MQVNVLSNGFHIVKTRDQIGGTLSTDVYELENGIFQAFSHYTRDLDEETIGFAEGFIAKEAIRLSRRDLRKKWQSQG
jgi:hypothetical protein